MYRYSSNITFLYYNNLLYGSYFMENILGLPMVMDQGFAKIYQVNKTSFIGIVKLSKEVTYKGNTLVSLNTNNVQKEYKRISKLDVFNLSEIQHIAQIPLDSFFFKDKEGHEFEIEEFLSEKDKKTY
ncbi:MAG: hypothetical protein JEZ05_08805 [Tenericutes bacterium]|nr:hypothetical protein [Mycoplasmatota bacterium]